MPAQHHKNAAAAAKKLEEHHTKAANEYEKGNHEKGAHHATTARGHESEVRSASSKATKAHSKKHANA